MGLNILKQTVWPQELFSEAQLKMACSSGFGVEIGGLGQIVTGISWEQGTIPRLTSLTGLTLEGGILVKSWASECDLHRDEATRKREFSFSARPHFSQQQCDLEQNTVAFWVPPRKSRGCVSFGCLVVLFIILSA